METIYKAHLYPTKQQITQFKANLNGCKWVYNYFLERKRDVYEQTHRNYYLKDCNAELVKKRRELPWLSKIDAVILQNTIKTLDEQFRAFIRAGKTKKDSLMPHYVSTYSEFKTKAAVLGPEYIKIPKMSPIRCCFTRKVKGTPVACTIKYKQGQYILLLECTDVSIEPLPKTRKTFVLDNNSLLLFTDEDEDFFNKNETILIRLEKQLKKQRFGSRNYVRTKQRIDKHYAKARNRLNDIIHKYTTNLIKEYDTIIINRISHAELYAKLVSQLQYKAKYYNKIVIIQKNPPSN